MLEPSASSRKTIKSDDTQLLNQEYVIEDNEITSTDIQNNEYISSLPIQYPTGFKHVLKYFDMICIFVVTVEIILQHLILIIVIKNRISIYLLICGELIMILLDMAMTGYLRSEIITFFFFV